MRAYFLRPALRPQAARRQPPAGPVISVLLGLAVSLGGCVGSFQWVKDGFSAHHAEAQFASCQLEAERLRSASLEALLKAERQRAEALELVARAERERAEVERLRGGDWRDRASRT